MNLRRLNLRCNPLNEDAYDVYIPMIRDNNPGIHLSYGCGLVEIDIKPGSCPNPLNVKGKGVLPVAVLGSKEFDVMSIYIASIRLAGVAPIGSSFEDVAAPVRDRQQECECTTEGPDGHLDLTLKFKTEDIVQALGEVVKGETPLLTLTGKLLDETPIEGADCIRVEKSKD
jgi:hypothetical protein